MMDEGGRLMKYMLIHCIDENAERNRKPEEYVSDAATVRVRSKELLVSDGPFAGTKEQIAGCDVIDCTDLDEAIEIASKDPTAWWGTIEVRPIAGITAETPRLTEVSPAPVGPVTHVPCCVMREGGCAGLG
jgi:hypothetical protein